MRVSMKEMLILSQRNSLMVYVELLRNFCLVFVYFTLALPRSRFYKMSIFLDMSVAEKFLEKYEEKGPTQGDFVAR